MAIEKISPEMQDKIKRKSAFSLPVRPSEENLGAERIKQSFYRFVTDGENSVVAEINRIVDQTNEALSEHNNTLVHKNTQHYETDITYVQLKDGTETVVTITPEVFNNSAVMRDENGRARVSSPEDNDDAANKGYVDGEISAVSGKLNSSIERLEMAENSLGGYTGTDGAVEYPVLSTENPALIPAVNELLEKILHLVTQINEKASARDPKTNGTFTHNGGISATWISSDNVSAQTFSSNNAELGNANANSITAESVRVVDLSVTGMATVEHQEELAVKDSLIILNSDGEDISASYSGIVIRKDADSAYAILLDSGTQTVKLGYGEYDGSSNTFSFNGGEDGAILIRNNSESMTHGSLLYWNGNAYRAVSSALTEELAQMLCKALVNISSNDGKYLCVDGGELSFSLPKSIEAVEQTTTSSLDGGENVLTVRMTDGAVSTFKVRNGSKGSAGERGATGAQGLPGVQGEKGDKGDKGEKGDPGEVSLAYAHKKLANALVGTASGEIVTINDVSPLEHGMRVRVSGVDDLSAVSINKLGKNLINASIFTKAGFADLGNGEFYTEYAKDVSQKVMFENISKISGSFYISGEWKHVLPEGALRGVYLTIYYVDGTTEDISMVQSTEYVSIVKQTLAQKTVDCIRFISGSGMAGTYFKNIQIEHRDTATAYEEGIEPTTYSVNPDGTVEGITSLYPSTTLMTDTPGALIECEYNRDLNKAFEQITQAILSLGGNI